MKNDNSDHAFAVDIWSLGCTIIEMLTGKPPWSEFEGAAAMFRVLSDTPPIPDALSSEGKDFLQCCFRRNPAERPSAAKLLDHRFLKSLSPLDWSLRGQRSFVRKSEMPRSIRERAKAAVDKPIFPLGTQNTKPKTDHDSDTGWLPLFKNEDLASVTRFSPRSILDTLPSLSLSSEQKANNPRTSPTVGATCNVESVIRTPPTFR